MGTAKVTQQGDTFTVEDANDEVHTALSITDVIGLLDDEYSEEEILGGIATSEGGVGLFDVSDPEDEEEDEDDEDEEDK